jgi:hypothetical protein
MMGTLGKDGLRSLDVHQVDFVYSEDADLSILNHFRNEADQFINFHLLFNDKRSVKKNDYTGLG